MAGRIPVSVITGFLGSGKTTLLNHLLQQPALKDAAVLVNELGEIGIDHLLVREVDENILRLATGCLCCAVRGDLVNTLRDLYAKRSRGGIPKFRRMLIETTGLADPAPILHTLMKDALMAARFRLDGVIATIDAVNGMNQLDRQPESVKQAAVADRLLLTKTDLANIQTVRRLRRRLNVINPSAPIYSVLHGRIDAPHLLDAGLYNPSTKTPDVRRWLNAEAYVEVSSEHVTHRHARLAGKRHTSPVRTFCLRFAEPVEWQAFADALQALIDRHGQDLLRVKGVLNVVGEAAPVVVHGVQHLFHPPVTLPAWPDSDRSSRLVFITRDLDHEIIARALRGLISTRREWH
jgi:G3E family GTPase